MSTAPAPFLKPEDAAATARTAGYALPPEAAARIAAGISPALQAFSAIAGTLPMDVEPASFTLVQHAGPEALK